MRFFKPREPFQVRLWAILSILGLSQKTINLARSIVTLVTLVSSKQGLSSSGSAGCWLLSSPKYFKNTKSRFFLNLTVSSPDQTADPLFLRRGR